MPVSKLSSLRLALLLTVSVASTPLAAQQNEPPPLTASEATITRGAQLYAQTCQVCHGDQVIGGVKDLRKMTRETHGKFNDIVLKGIYADKGMASFADLLKPDEVDAIHGYIIARSNEDWGRARESTGDGPH